MSDPARFNPYIAHGWKLCIIPPGKKGPVSGGWNTPEKAVRAASEWPLGFGAGLLHAYSGTCALDIDHMELARDFLASKGIDLDALLADPESVQISSGREGRAKLLYALPTPLPSFKLCPYQLPDVETGKPKTYHALELRCGTADGQLSVQDVLPPSIHPRTHCAYEWRYFNDITAHWTALPHLPEALQTLWTKSASTGAIAQAAGPAVQLGAEFEELQTLLAGEDPDTDYDTWVNIGMAIHHETRGAPMGLALWDAWSRKGVKYGAGATPQFPQDKWGSFRYDEGGAITLGWLRSRQVASVEMFPVVPESTTPAPMAASEFTPREDYGTDTRPDAVLQRLVGDNVVYVRKIDRYFDIRTREIYITPDALKNAFNPDIPLFVSDGKDAKGNHREVRNKPDPIKWLQNSEVRRSRDVQAVGMHPGEGATFLDRGERYANAYRPRPPIEALKPTQFEREAFRFIWSRIVDAKFADWLARFYAHMLQKPGVKIQTAPLLVSETTGTGKSTIIVEIPKLLFGRVELMTEAEIRSPYSGQLAHAWYVAFEEVCAGSTKSERRFVTDKVKPWITNPEIVIRPMFMPAFTIPNRLQFGGCSNHPDALQLEDENERRWGVGAVKEERYSPAEELDVYQGFLHTDRGPGVLKWIFQNLDTTGFQPTGKAPITLAKRVMVAMGRGVWENNIAEAMESRSAPFDKDIFTLADVQTYIFGGRGGPSRVSLGHMMCREPFSCLSLPNHQAVRMYAWRNKRGWGTSTLGQRQKYLETGVLPFPDETPVVQSVSDVSDLI